MAQTFIIVSSYISFQIVLQHLNKIRANLLGSQLVWLMIVADCATFLERD